MPKRNQYNHGSLNQLVNQGSVSFSNIVRFNDLNVKDGLVCAQGGLLQSDATVISNGTNVGIDFGNRAAQFMVFTNISLTDGQAFTITLTNPQITTSTMIMAGFACNVSLGICCNPLVIGTGTATINAYSAGSTLAGSTAFFYYLLIHGIA